MYMADTKKCVKCVNTLNGLSVEIDFFGTQKSHMTDFSPVSNNTAGSCSCRSMDPEYRRFAIDGYPYPADSPCHATGIAVRAFCTDPYQFDPQAQKCVLCRNDWNVSPPPAPAPCGCVTEAPKWRRRVVSTGRCPPEVVAFTPYCRTGLALNRTTNSCTSCPAPKPLPSPRPVSA
jgi:hypothetical protein